MYHDSSSVASRIGRPYSLAAALAIATYSALLCPWDTSNSSTTTILGPYGLFHGFSKHARSLLCLETAVSTSCSNNQDLL